MLHLKEYEQYLIPNFEVWSIVEITFGKRSSDCSGSGICSMTAPHNYFSMEPCRKVKAIVQYERGGPLVIKIPKAEIKCPRYVALLGRPEFEVEEAFELPKFLLPKMDGRYEISEGTYPVKQDGEYVRLEVKMQKISVKKLKNIAV